MYGFFNNMSYPYICFSFCPRCGVEGIRVACTPTNNTVCKDKIEGMDEFSAAAFELNHNGFN